MMRIQDVVRSLRPNQWTKNLFVFAAFLFAQKFLDVSLLLKTFGAFVVFCILSGALYIWNDVYDINEDRFHPKKSKRPIASGRIKQNQAVFLFIVLIPGGLVPAYYLDPKFFLVCVIYVLLQIAYSLKLKHVVILDIFIIAAGFVLRVIAGGLVIDVPISSWILICTTLLALFIAMSKRRHEITLLEDNAINHRPILREYSAYLLDQMIGVVTASTLIAYCLYTISDETVQKFGTRNLIYTTPFVLYGIFRYLYLVHQKGEGGSPEELVLKDRSLFISIILWVAAVILVIYFV